MLHIPLVLALGLAATASRTFASPVENEKTRRECHDVLRELFAPGAPTFASLTERLNLQSSFALEIFDADLRRCPECVPMAYSPGVLARIPPGLFAQILLHDPPEFRAERLADWRKTLGQVFAKLGPGGQVIVTRPAPVAWAELNRLVAVARELGYASTLLSLAEFDLGGVSLVHP